MKSGLSLIVSKMYLIGMLFCIVFVAATSSLAENYYVSPSGTALWGQCTNINTPCSAKTGLANAQAGDVVYFRGGTYMAPVTESGGYTPALKPSNSGTNGSPITFKAYPDEIPFIDNTNNQGAEHAVVSFGVYGHDWIIWDGFHTEAIADLNNMSKGVIFYNADHCTLKNSTIEGYTSGVSNNVCIRAENAEYLTVENNILFNSLGDSANSAAYQAYNTSNVTMYNNDIYDCDAAILDKKDGQNNSYFKNHIWNCDYAFYIVLKWAACHNIYVYQNIIRNISVSYGIVHTNAGVEGGSSDDFKFYNNTFYNTNAGGICLDSPDMRTTEIFNNIIHTTNTATRTYTGLTGTFIDYNDYYSVTNWNIDAWDGTYYNSLSAWQAGTGFDGNSVTTNPNFVNAGGTSPEDYKRTSYPTNGRGGSYASVMGAYITGNEIIGYSGEEGTPPSPPSPPPDFSTK